MNRQRWVLFDKKYGITAHDFVTFMLQILVDIGPETTERRMWFTFNNFTAHLHAAVIHATLATGHQVVLHALYYPVYGAIEYVSNSIQQ